jgi:hypothetical protein
MVALDTSHRFGITELHQSSILFVFPNLITVTSRRKQVSGFLERGTLHRSPLWYVIVLFDTVVLSNPSNVGKNSAKRRSLLTGSAYGLVALGEQFASPTM